MLTFLTIAFGVFSVLLILVILIQKPQGGGLTSAFGAGGGQSAVFGAKTGDILTVITMVGFALFLLLAIANVMVARSDSKGINIPVPVAQEFPVTPEQLSDIPAPAITIPDAPEAPEALKKARSAQRLE